MGFDSDGGVREMWIVWGGGLEVFISMETLWHPHQTFQLNTQKQQCERVDSSPDVFLC